MKMIKNYEYEQGLRVQRGAEVVIHTWDRKIQ